MDQPQFGEDLDAVVLRAEEAGVTLIVDPAVDVSSCRQVVGLAERFPGLYGAVGIHPNECEGFDKAALETVRSLACHPKVVAIGEIGLDYYWHTVPEEQQKRALREQLELASELDLPVILHSRNSNADLLCELEQWVPTARKQRGADAILGVWHAFSGDLADAERAFDLGFVLGLGGTVTFKNSRRLRELVPMLRVDRILMETDSPYMTPHPYRGKRNEPAYIRFVWDVLSELMGVEREALARLVGDTARLCFEKLQV